MEDSQGMVPTLSGSSQALQTSFERLRQATGEPITPAQLSDQLTRLNAVFGDPKGRADEQMFIMAREWFSALKGFGFKTLQLSVTKHIRDGKWWPALSEIVALCRAEDESWRDVYGLVHMTGQPTFAAGKEPNLSVDELAKRAAAIMKFKADYGFNKPEHDIRIGEDTEVRASQEMTVSAELMRSCAVRRAKGLPTCRNDCAYQNCELRTNEELQC